MQRLFTLTRNAMVCFGLMTGLLPGLQPSLAQASVLRQAAEPVTLRLAMPAPETLDPVQLSRFDPSTRDLVENLFVGLTRINPYTHAIEPMLAKSWTVSDDGLTWTFELRDDVQWVRFDPDKGEVVPVRPVAAGDLVYAIHRACDPRRPSPVTSNLMVIQGCLTVANAFPEVINDVFLAREIGVKATGPSTLEITLEFPSGFLPTLLSTPELRPLPREAVSTADDWAAADALLSDGPFVLRDWTTSGMSLIRNPYWPDTQTGNVEAVAVTFTSDTVSPVDLATGERIDLARLAPSDSSEARAALPDLFHANDGTSLTLLGFSHERALVSDPNVRRALSYAIDRDALVRQFFPDQAGAALAFTPADVIAAPTGGETLFDPAEAQAAFAAAGYPNCAGLPEHLILLVPDDNPLWENMGQAITQQWTTVLGCDAALFEVQAISRTLLIEIAHSTYDPEKVTRSHMWIATWSADYPDANAWLNDALHCQFGYLRTGRECSDADTAMDHAAAQTDVTARAELYTRAEQVLFGPGGSFPVTPLFRSTAAWLQQPWLSNVNETGPARFDAWVLDLAQQPAH